MRIDSNGIIKSNGASNTYGGAGSLSLNANAGSAIDLELRVGNTNVGYFYADSTNVQLANAQSGYLSMLTNNTERLRITSGGLVCIGTSTGIGRLTLEDQGGSLLTTPLTINSTSGAGDRYSANFYYSGTRVGSITVNASATASTLS